MVKFESVQELVENAAASGKTISEIVLEAQTVELGQTREDIYRGMEENLNIMEEAVESGIKSAARSASGLTGGDALKMAIAIEQGRTLAGGLFDMAIARAIAVAEVNACMGRIVAAPTAGSCGILPAVLLTVMKEKNLPRNKAVMGLLAAAGLGIVIAKRASISGAEAGCQAECGSASAMAAAAVVEMAGGTPSMMANACAIAFKNLMGLVCDPVAGLVEVPCVKRNAIGAANALTAADMALSGIVSAIPVDEVIDAIKAVGREMPCTMKETAEGGLAATPTARCIAARLLI